LAYGPKKYAKRCVFTKYEKSVKEMGGHQGKKNQYAHFPLGVAVTASPPPAPNRVK